MEDLEQNDEDKSSDTIQGLRKKLFETLEKLESRKISMTEAKAITVVAQTIINSVRLELDYKKLVKNKDVKFLE